MTTQQYDLFPETPAVQGQKELAPNEYLAFNNVGRVEVMSYRQDVKERILSATSQGQWVDIRPIINCCRKLPGYDFQLVVRHVLIMVRTDQLQELKCYFGDEDPRPGNNYRGFKPMYRSAA